MTVSTMLHPRRSPLLRDRAAAAAQRGSWPVSITLTVLIVAAAVLLAPITSTPSWLMPAAISAAATMVASQLARQLTAATGWSALAAAAAAIVALIVVAGPTNPLEVFTILGKRVAEFVTQLGSDLPPLQDSPAVTVIAVALVLLITIIVDLIAFALRAPVAAALPLLVFPALNLAVGRPTAPFAAWLTVIALILVLLYVAARWDRACEDAARAQLGYTADRRGAGGLFSGSISALAAVAVASLVAVLLPPASGLWWDAMAPTSSLATNRVNPIIDLGDDLRRNSPVTVLTYATSQTEGTLPYLALTSISEFREGAEWRPRDFEADSELPTEQPVAPPSELGTDTWAMGVESDVNIILKQGVTPYLPHFTALDSFEQVSGDYRRDETSGDVREVSAEALAQSYHVKTAPVRPSDDELVTLSPEQTEALQPYLELPDAEQLEQVRAAMDEVLDPNASPYQQALQLQSWFTGGAFEYSEQTPVSEGYDGTSVRVIERFLEMRSGYCVHFASTMAVMGRMLGIPTRIQVGFTPGTPQGTNSVGQTVFEVTSDNLHAWAELWVPGYGWVPFETTPAVGIGEIPAPQPAEIDTSTESATPTTAEPASPETPTPTPTPTSPEETNETQAPDEPSQPSSSDSGPRAPWLPWAAGIIALLGGVVVGIYLPRWIRARQRRIRLERVRSRADGAMAGADAELHAAAAAWREVLATAADHGLTIRSGTRGREREQLLQQLAAGAHPDASPQPAPDAVEQSLQRLTSVWDHAAFAQPDAAAMFPAEADVHTVLAAIAASGDDAARRRAKWAPASLRASRKNRKARRR